MAEPAQRRWTVEEFLAWDDGTDRRYELVDGRIVAIEPSSEAHATIVPNLAMALRHSCDHITACWERSVSGWRAATTASISATWR